MEVGEFADSIKDRITSFNSLALAQSLRSHAFCNKKKKEDVSTHCCFAYENPKSTPLPLYIVLSFWSSTLTNALKWKGLLKKRERRRVELLIMSQYTLMMRCVKDTHCDGLLSVKAICIWHGRKKKKNGGWGGAGGGREKFALASSNLLLCIISSQFAACPRFVCYTKEREGCWRRALHLHAATTHLSLLRRYIPRTEEIEQQVRQYVSGMFPQCKALGVIKGRGECRNRE